MIQIPTENTDDVRILSPVNNLDELIHSLKPCIDSLNWRATFVQHLPFHYRKWVQYGLRYYNTIEGCNLQWRDNNPENFRIKVKGSVKKYDPLYASSTLGVCETKIPVIGDWLIGYSAEDKSSEGIEEIRFSKNILSDNHYSESDFKDWIPGTNLVKQLFENLNTELCGRVRLLSLPIFSCYSYHIDSGTEWRIHIPLITNERSFFIVDGVVWHMPVGYAYLLNTTKLHTALNSGASGRIHLVAGCPPPHSST